MVFVWNFRVLGVMIEGVPENQANLLCSCFVPLPWGGENSGNEACNPAFLKPELSVKEKPWV